MKKKIAVCVKLFVVSIFLILSSSCSNNKELELKLTKEYLVGTMWKVQKFEVRRKPDYAGKYYLYNYSTKTCIFEENGILKYSNIVATSDYDILNEVFYMDGSIFKISKFTRDYIELISEKGLTDDMATESGYGFLVKYELRKI